MSLFLSVKLPAQLSPGDLTRAHEQLEGLTNCTQCHVLGKKVTNEKCLDCHKEIRNLIDSKRGYHASAEVKGKDCFVCHSEHHGKNFQITRFDQENFDHKLTGYVLEGKHAKINCKDCHKPEFVQKKITRKKSAGTFLGLQTSCLTCHEDFHQQSLSPDCASCHGFDAFRPAPGFDHQKTAFPLRGKHQQADCAKCHREEERNGKKIQHFTNVAFANCTACHEDVHKNKFGQDCTTCHSENSFHQVASLPDFNHNRTGFPLTGKHQTVDCRLCHKQSFTAKITHNRCSNCHSDYHKGQFAQNGKSPDCADCHTVNGFIPSFFTIEMHNQGKFRLEGAHLATPCFSCHRQNERWEFRQIGGKCVDCHKNIHQGFMADKYIPEQRCEICHSVNDWDGVTFDHRQTGFALEGKHAETTCRKCHFAQENGSGYVQRFSNMESYCESCHADVHRDQFRENYKTRCDRCHGFENWEASRFDHDRSRFKLEGAHTKVDCGKCHAPATEPEGTYTRYKLFKNEIQCVNCHS